MENYYQVLNVIDFAEVEVIKASYKALSKKYHPDLNKDANPEIMVKINNAYDVLSNEDTKKIYDEQLKEYYRSINEEKSKAEDIKNDSHQYMNEDFFEEKVRFKTFRFILSLFIGISLAILGGFLVPTLISLDGSWSYIVYTIYGGIVGGAMRIIAKSESYTLGCIGACFTLIGMVLPFYLYLYDFMPIVYGNMGEIEKFIKATQEVISLLLGSGLIRLFFVVLTPCATFSSITE